MAKPKAPKLRDQESAKVRISLTVDAALLKRYRHAAVELDLTESELFERLAAIHFAAVHARGVSDALRSSMAIDPGQGRAGDPEPPAPTVRISGITNRIGDIARKSAAPIDDAIDGLVSE